jgi:glyoxylase-like metal-dependent hydrolase (beta-lactamase superfamily II)
LAGRQADDELKRIIVQWGRPEMIRAFIRCVGVLAALMPGAAIAAVQQNPGLETAAIEVLPVQGNVYLLAGGGGNTTVQIGDDGVLFVDTKVAELSEKILALVRQMTKQTIRYIVNTHYDPDHVGGNETIGKAGSTRIGGGFVNNIGAASAAQTKVIAHLNVLARMSNASGSQPSEPQGTWPTDTYMVGQKELFFNGEAIQIIHQPAAHTDGDSIVFFRRSDVISTGDIFDTTSYPVIDLERGGSTNGLISALNRILDLIIPGPMQQGGTMVVPGHGRISDEHDVLEYRDMLTIIRDRIQDMVQKGMTLEQVLGARPTLDYDARYGTDAGFRTTRTFIESVYQDLSRNDRK